MLPPNRALPQNILEKCTFRHAQVKTMYAGIINHDHSITTGAQAQALLILLVHLLYAQPTRSPKYLCQTNLGKEEGAESK